MKSPPKGPGGRPTKYKTKFCKTVISIGSEGGWLSEMAEACDVHRSTMDEWAATYPKFSEALMRAKQKAQAWFEREGRLGLSAEKFNSALWAKQMSARHRDEYTERREVSGPDGGPIETSIIADDAFARLASRLGGIAPGAQGGADGAE